MMFLLTVVSTALAGDISPKMVAEQITPGTPLGPPASDDGKKSETISSTYAVYLGDCAPGTPFTFPIDNVTAAGT